METQKEDFVILDNPEERQLMIHLYKLIVNKADNQLEILAKHKDMLNTPIYIECRWRCSCINLFEQHPGHNADIEGELYKMVYTWIGNGRCRCHGVNQNFEARVVSKQLIHVAAVVGNFPVIKFLIDNGCSLNELTSISNYSPLFLAILINNIALLRYMILHGAEINQTSRFEQNTPLMEAMLTRKKEVFDILLNEVSLDINALNLRRESALTVAVRIHTNDLIPILVKKGSDPNHVDITGSTPLIHSVLGDDDKLTKILIECGADVNKTDNRGETALHIAVHNEAIVMVRVLLQNGADPNIKAIDGYSPILISSYSQSDQMLQVLQMLLEYGADVNLSNEEQYTAIHIAAWNGFLSTVKYLLMYNSPHEIKTVDKNTPLTLAAHGKHPLIIDHLLPLGCDVNNKDKDLDTALHYAAFNDDSETVQKLLQYGADPDVKNRLDVTPLWNAVYAGSIDVIKLFLKYNVVLETATSGIDQHAQSNGVVSLYPEPKTPMWVAAEKGFTEIAMLLIAAGYNVSKENWLMNTMCLPTMLEKNVHFRHLLLSYYNTPPRLLAICRNFFRKLFDKNILDKTEALDIPRTLKSYISLQDIL